MAPSFARDPTRPAHPPRSPTSSMSLRAARRDARGRGGRHQCHTSTIRVTHHAGPTPSSPAARTCSRRQPLARCLRLRAPPATEWVHRTVGAPPTAAAPVGSGCCGAASLRHGGVDHEEVRQGERSGEGGQMFGGRRGAPRSGPESDRGRRRPVVGPTCKRERETGRVAGQLGREAHAVRGKRKSGRAGREEPG